MGTKNFSNANDLITFSRASAGTALRKIAYGSELVTNGDFSTDDLSGWEIYTDAAGDAEINVVNGELIFTASDTHNLRYALTGLTAGALYRVEHDVVTSGWTDLKISENADGTGTIEALTGIVSVGNIAYFVATSGTNYFIGRRNGATTVGLDNVSVKEVLFDQGTLTLFNHPADIPRIEYDADGNVLGLLIEESRTNLLPYSEDFTDAQWSKTYSVAVSPSSEAAPNGQKVAYELTGIESSDGDAGINEFISASASTTYTGTIWFKAKNASDVGKYIRLRLKRNGGTFVAQDESVQLTNSWVRHEVTLTLLSDNTGIGFIITKDSTQNTVNRADECLIYGAQLEAGAFPTSYIPTYGATATRSADVASIPVSAFGYNQSEGTVVVEGTQYESSNSISRFVELYGGGTGSGGYLSLGVYQDSSWIETYNGDVLNLYDVKVSGERQKMASGFDSSGNTFCGDGNILGTPSTSSLVNPSSVSLLYVGVHWAGIQQLNGHIKSIKYFPRKLTNAQLQELTT
jgi:hypothetical protein